MNVRILRSTVCVFVGFVVRKKWLKMEPVTFYCALYMKKLTVRKLIPDLICPHRTRKA